eukprot:TRINITY_DN39146_c0_g1_i1.p1 TRINITY_DN39146_c0_g1~~TRINITY_DN39146_c0_g1_i1.p1  ORF type:complete len:274 (+),score=42.69 TRINITY_DN39146_c0_g1_i1:600-1421(+)
MSWCVGKVYEEPSSQVPGNAASKSLLRNSKSSAASLQPAPLLEKGGFPLKTFDGDQASVGDWLRLAGLALDDPLPENAPGVRQSGDKQAKTWRSCGLAISIGIEYTNLGPWVGFRVTPFSQSKPRYIIEVSREPTSCLSTTQGRSKGDTYEFQRLRSVNFQVAQSGEIAIWDSMNFLVTLATVFSLTSFAKWILDKGLQNFYTDDWYLRMKFDTYDENGCDTTLKMPSPEPSPSDHSRPRVEETPSPSYSGNPDGIDQRISGTNSPLVHQLTP